MVNLKSILKHMMAISVIKDFIQDYIFFVKHSNYKNNNISKERLEFSLLKDYHKIEKGLSLSFPRPDFGSKVIEKIVSNLEIYKDDYEEYNMELYNDGCILLANYLETNKNSIAIKFLNSIQNKKDFEKKRYSNIDYIHQKKFTPEIDTFLKSRRSVRTFQNKKIPFSVVRNVVEKAQYAPSACNRQEIKIYNINEYDKIKGILDLQNGNRGVEGIGNMLVLTVNFNSLFLIEERNQGYVDAGIFTYSVILNMHNIGIGSLVLNASLKKKDENAIKRFINASSSEKIVCFILYGEFDNGIKVAKSKRLNVDNVLHLV